MMQLRSPEHGLQVETVMIENGIFVSKNVHSMLGEGEVAFIKV